MFSTDVFELKAMSDWLKQEGPKAFQHITAQFLNDIAFGARQEIHEYLDSSMTIRGKFVKSKIRVWRANGATPIDAQKSAVGSVYAPRFSGLVEQEFGVGTKRKKYGTLKGRGGSTRRRIKGKYRMKRPFIDPSNFPNKASWMTKYGKSSGLQQADDAAVFGMLRTLGSLNYKQPFVIAGHSTIPSGIYKFSSKRNRYGHHELELLQGFERKQPKLNKWMSKSIKRYLKSNQPERMWVQAVRKELVFRNRGKMHWFV